MASGIIVRHMYVGGGSFTDDGATVCDACEPGRSAGESGGNPDTTVECASCAAGNPPGPATILLALLEECNPDASIIVAAYEPFPRHPEMRFS